MANIVTWQERGINLLATKNASKDILNVITKVHFVQFATLQQPEHKCQILGREVTSCLKPIASSHSDMSKISLYRHIMHIDSAVRKECSEGIFVIKYVIYSSVTYSSPAARIFLSISMMRSTIGSLHSLRNSRRCSKYSLLSILCEF